MSQVVNNYHFHIMKKQQINEAPMNYHKVHHMKDLMYYELYEMIEKKPHVHFLHSLHSLWDRVLLKNKNQTQIDAKESALNEIEKMNQFDVVKPSKISILLEKKLILKLDMTTNVNLIRGNIKT